MAKMALTLKFKRRRNKKKKVNCQLIENPKMRRGPHKMPSRAACGPRAACLRPLLYIYQRYMAKVRRSILKLYISTVSRQLVYGHFVYDTSSTDTSSTDSSSTTTFLAEIEAGVMKRILYQ